MEKVFEGRIDIAAMKAIGKAIKELDQYHYNKTTVGIIDNDKRITLARNKLINVLFSCGYELQHNTYRVVKSISKRELMPE
jgi:hypothetical protein